MKRIFAIGIIGVILGIGVALHMYSPHDQVNHIASPSPTLIEKSHDQPTEPTRLIIPSLQVNAPVESVGLDSEKRMDVPQNVQDAAWYNLGAKPGELGSAVIDGHLDTQTGAPAIFYYLKNLQVGDILQTVDTRGKAYTFRVTKITTYPYDQLPLQTIFAANDKPRLNLITCGGAWDRTKKNYSQRTVTYAELVKN